MSTSDWTATLRQTAETVREALARGARETRDLVEDALRERRRAALLVELGERALVALQRGEPLEHDARARELAAQLAEPPGDSGVPDAAQPAPSGGIVFDDDAGDSPP